MVASGTSRSAWPGITRGGSTPRCLARIQPEAGRTKRSSPLQPGQQVPLGAAPARRPPTLGRGYGLTVSLKQPNEPPTPETMTLPERLLKPGMMNPASALPGPN